MAIKVDLFSYKEREVMNHPSNAFYKPQNKPVTKVIIINGK